MKKALKIKRYYTTLGGYLQRARIRMELTQREVSILLGYSSAQFISNFERGISAPPAKKMRLLLSVYRLKAAAVIERQLEGERQALRAVIR